MGKAKSKKDDSTENAAAIWKAYEKSMASTQKALKGVVEPTKGG